MKKVFFLMLAVASLGITSSFAGVDENKSEKEVSLLYPTNFCKGWIDGYTEGYRYAKGTNAVTPQAPHCPSPNFREDSYQEGYNRGFVAGLADGKKY